MPGVTSAGLVSPTLPFTFNFNQQEMRIDNRTYNEGRRGEIIENVAVSPGYLPTLGVPVIEGRNIEASDIAGGPDVAVNTQTMARRFWPDESAVGHTFQVVNPTRTRTFRIVGVTRDHKRHGVLEQASPFVYYAEAQRASRYNFLLARTSGDATVLVNAMRQELLAMEPGLVFMAGMMAADGLNGLWVARMLTKADRRALIASRVMSLVIGALGIAIAALGVARYFSPGFGALMDGSSVYFGIAMLLLLLGSYAVAVRITAAPVVAR